MQETVLHLVIMTIAFTLYNDWSTATIEAARNCTYISSHNKEQTCCFCSMNPDHTHTSLTDIRTICQVLQISLVPRPSPPPVFYRLQYAVTQLFLIACSIHFWQSKN